VSIDLSDCEKEQIHIPNLIQPHGVLIGFEKSDLIITRVSRNTSFKSNISPHLILGQNLSEVFSPRLFDLILAATISTEFKRLNLFGERILKISDDLFDLILCDSGSEIIIEIIPSILDETDSYFTNNRLNETVRKLITTKQIFSLFDEASKEIKELTGYERVLIYKFDEEFNGEVIAEAKDQDLESYLNLHYPASDIPSQARELFRKNMIRTIVDVDYEPVTVESFDKFKNVPLDMSYSYLRSVSPIHLEYLHNMGVQSTLTISIIVKNKLWGLISCHKRESHVPSLKKLNLIEILANILGGIIQERESSENERRNSELLARLDIVMEMILIEDKRLDLLELIKRKLNLIHSIFKSEGFIFSIGNSVITHNTPISEEYISLLIEKLKPFLEDGIFYTNHLISQIHGLPDIIYEMFAGMMVLKIDTNPVSYWIWRRQEMTQTISWGGNPNQKAFLNQKGLISPRKSFEKYNQILTKKSIPWDTAERELNIYLTPRLYHLVELFESSKEIEFHKKHILHIEEERTRHFEELIEMLVGLIEMRDAYTANHTRRVAQYSIAIAEELKLNPEDISRLREAAILHDIGKIIIPDSILLKPGKLTFKEYELIKQHAIVGHQLLNKIDYYRPIAEIIRYHHEKYDGTGYPDGKKGEEIPFLSHIMIVADAYDAMTTNRIYQTGKNIEHAISELKKYRGIWYHPDVVDAAIIVTNRKKSLSEKTSQLPTTQIEKERFVYFFKDQLTGVYNATYLWMVINDMVPSMRYSFFALVELHGMSNFNTQNGWTKGNQMIQDIATQTVSLVKEDQVFRVFGDDFIVCFNTEEERDAFIKAMNLYLIEGISFECKSIQKEKFIETLEV